MWKRDSAGVGRASTAWSMTAPQVDLRPDSTVLSPSVPSQPRPSDRHEHGRRLDVLLDDFSGPRPVEAAPSLTADLGSVPEQATPPLSLADGETVTPLTMAPAPAVGLLRTQWIARYTRWVVVGDAVSALLGAVVALAVRFGLVAVEGPNELYLPLSLVFPCVWVALLAMGRSYEPRFIGEGTDEFRRVIDSAVRVIALVAVVSYVLNWGFARGYLVVALPVATLGSLAVRAIGRRALKNAQAQGRATRRVLVTGTERATAEMIRRLQQRGDHPFDVVGALVDHSRSTTIEGVPVVGRAADTSAAVVAMGADTVAIAAWSTFSQNDLRRLSWELEDSHVDILVTPNLVDVSGPRISIRPVAGLPLLHVEKPEFTGFRRVAKALFDRGVALIALLVLWPLLLVLAIAVRLDSEGPAFFKQERVGKGGRTFTMVKLRSMSVDAEDLLESVAGDNVHAEGPLFKAHSDPRITRVGALLRRTSLDELPQLFNILFGQMSLVGPRPPLLSEVEQYESDVRRRFLVKPGLTGLWQVSGRSDLSWEDSVRLDLFYVENWTFLLDIEILARTFRAVVAARGAY